MCQSVRVSINWKRYTPNGGHPAQSLLDLIHTRLQELRSDKAMPIATHLDADECNYVFLGCGSCENGGAKVEAYCSSSGGNRPDFTWCENC